MNDAQIKNMIRFENQLAKIHTQRAHELTMFLKKRQFARAESKAKLMTDEILGKLKHEQTSK